MIGSFCRRFVFLVIGSGMLQADETLAGAHVGESSVLKVSDTEAVIRVEFRGKPVIDYVKKDKPVPEGLPKEYRRSGYIHPVCTPDGRVVTGDFPADHPHQHALFSAWTKTRFKGKSVDFWNLAKDQGRVEHREVLAIERGDNHVSFTVRLTHVAGNGADREDVLNETWKVTVHETPEDYFLFDIESVQECAGDEPLILPKYHYGGMALRATSQWFVEDGAPATPESGLRFLTSEGLGREKGNHTRADWVAMSGPIDGGMASVVVMGHPENFRAPQHVRIHPDKPYFCFAPMVAGEFRIEPGERHVARYRYLTTDRDVDREQVNRLWESYLGEGK